MFKRPRLIKRPRGTPRPRNHLSVRGWWKNANTQFNFTIWKNNTSPEARILSPFRTPLNPSTLREASLFAHFWVDPKSKIILPTLPNCHRYHVVFEVAWKNQKTRYRCTNDHKMDHCFATEFYLYFSGNPPNVASNGIFPTQKTLQKVMKITRFELLRGRFTYRDQASRRELKIMQNYSKMQHKSPRNEHEKT